MDSGIDAVISCIGMQRFGVPRIIAVSAAGVANSAAQLNMVMRVMLTTTMISTAYADLNRMEYVLANSGLDWLAPRPTRLIDGVPTGRVRVTNRFATADSIRRADVAWWMIRALNHRIWPLAEWDGRTPQITAD